MYAYEKFVYYPVHLDLSMLSHFNTRQTSGQHSVLVFFLSTMVPPVQRDCLEIEQISRCHVPVLLVLQYWGLIPKLGMDSLAPECGVLVLARFREFERSKSHFSIAITCL
jgi:hypothetical protein